MKAAYLFHKPAYIIAIIYFELLNLLSLHLMLLQYKPITRVIIASVTNRLAIFAVLLFCFGVSEVCSELGSP